MFVLIACFVYLNILLFYLFSCVLLAVWFCVCFGWFLICLV